ncbi:hypothetical protein [Campylobacter hyointestinalis]|nr:hypothetical protein [Campylobacter hyointestinalis]
MLILETPAFMRGEYVIDEELKNLKNTAKSIGMPTSTYIRFKLFS